jgi:hypothetical protein
MYAHWLGLYRENPSQQRFWPTDLYRPLWRSQSGRVKKRADGRVIGHADLDFACPEKVGELEAWCRGQVETVLALHDIHADEACTLRAQSHCRPSSARQPHFDATRAWRAQCRSRDRPRRCVDREAVGESDWAD